jgi:peroxiredoxin
MLETNIFHRADGVAPNTVTEIVSDLTFKTRRHQKWADVTTTDLIQGTSVMASAMPSARTPTCLPTPVPR